MRRECPKCGKRFNVADECNLDAIMHRCRECGYEGVLRIFVGIDSDVDSDVDSVQTHVADIRRQMSDPMFVDLYNGINYPITPGKVHVVGRDAPGSKATILLNTGSNMMVSRNQFYVELKNYEGHYRACISLHENAKNEMMVGNEVLSKGDVIILDDGDILDICGYKLKYQK